MKGRFSLSVMLAVVAFVILTIDAAHAATRTVTKTADTDDGVCDSDCSLREAIAVAVPGDTGTAVAPLNPLLDPLGDYGGMTATHRLQDSSPAIDKRYSFGLTTDQRGFTRPFDKQSSPNAPGGDGSDIGAYEVRFTVTIIGTVFDPGSTPLKKTKVLLRSESGEKRKVKTDKHGVFRFDDVARNSTYQISPVHNFYQFAQKTVIVTEEDINGLDLMALP